ncbi:MAG: FHA domain-containing protein [Lentisphaerota bacterium]
MSYTKKDGTRMEFELGERPITIGRSPEADVVILDEKSSRLHCGIRLWDGDFYLKDLKSRNGTFVNGEKIDVAKLKPGDRFQVGSIVMSFDQDSESGGTAIQEVEDAMASGKGYSTILREIVDDLGAPTSEAEVQDADKPLRVKTRKPKSAG